jgi:flavin-dependent dehydrogenase
MEVKAVVIGAGVVGLAATRRLAELGREVVVLDQKKRSEPMVRREIPRSYMPECTIRRAA